MTTFHCYVCDNIDSRLFELHDEASKIAGLDVKYHVFKIAELQKAGMSPHQAHGWFMEQILQNSREETIGFLDVDCIISSASYVEQWSEMVEQSGTLVGTAQSANHLPSCNEIYAAPAMMIMRRNTWELMDEPSLIADNKYDTAQRLSHELIKNHYHIDILMPMRHADEGDVWPLANKGEYGTGTIYGEGQVFHLFQSAKGPSYVHLLEQKVEQLRSGSTLFA